MSDPRHRAWDDIHELLPAGWQVGPALFNRDPSRAAWGAAHGPIRGRRKPPETISAEGEDELAALTELVLALRELARQGQMPPSSSGRAWPTSPAPRSTAAKRIAAA